MGEWLLIISAFIRASCGQNKDCSRAEDWERGKDTRSDFSGAIALRKAPLPHWGMDSLALWAMPTFGHLAVRKESSFDSTSVLQQWKGEKQGAVLPSTPLPSGLAAPLCPSEAECTRCWWKSWTRTQTPGVLVCWTAWGGYISLPQPWHWIFSLLGVKTEYYTCT